MKSAGWDTLDELATAISALSSRAEQLLTELADTIDQLADTHPSATGPTAGLTTWPTSIARELNIAAARLHHASTGIAVVTTGCVEPARLPRTDATNTTRQWVARHTGLSRSEANKRVRISHARTLYPLLGNAMLHGRITAEHVHAAGSIVPSRFHGHEAQRLIEQVIEIQPALLNAAETMTVDEFEELCARVRARLDDDGPNDRTAEPSRIRLVKLFDGRWSLSGDLSAIDGATLATMLADRIATTKPAAESAAQSEPREFVPEPELRARALIDLVAAGAGTTRPGRVSMFVHIDLDDLITTTPTLSDLIARNRNARTEAGIDIDTDSLWGLLAGADVTPVFNLAGTPLSYGRTRRLAPPILRRILAFRDRGCRFPGCHHPPNRCEIHHIQHWDNNGPTNPDNLIHLSSGHHHDHHDRGWRISGNANGPLEIRRPNGELFDAAPAYRHRIVQHDNEERDLIRQRFHQLRQAS